MSKSGRGLQSDAHTELPYRPQAAGTSSEEADEEIYYHDEELPSWLPPSQQYGLQDALVTPTSIAAYDVTEQCLPLLLPGIDSSLTLNSHGIPRLRRDAHAAFLRSNLARLPAPYVAMDASRPWMFYWVIAGLCFLGEDVSHYKVRLQETVRPLQNHTGGFGGGHGQLSHVAGTYACILALACVGGLDMVDRRSMWHFLGAIKHPNGGFYMAVGAEEDVRGAYCAMTVIALLNLPLTLPPDAPARAAGLETFTDGLGAWIGRCQTYEGGIAGAPINEAHGAYAFCALACLSIIDAPHISIPKWIDVQALIAWLVASQTTPEGGFQGRTNKLVDACYSHWSGSCWSILHAVLGRTEVPSDQPPDLWNREAQVRYLLCCCQDIGKRGGMRDKPSARSDAYHTCYSLSGLSTAQNTCRYTYDSELSNASSQRLLAAFNWTAEPPTAAKRRPLRIDKDDVVGFVHPVFVIPMEAVENARLKFESLPLE